MTKKSPAELPFHVRIMLDEFEMRKQKNERYSLRSFARDLQISPSILSRALRDQSRMSLKTSAQISKGLRMTADQTRAFRESVIAANESLVKKPPEESRLKSVSDAALASMFDFRNMIIGATLRLKSCDGDPASIAALTGIPVGVVREQLEQTVKFGLLTVVNGKYFPVPQVEQVHFDASESTWPLIRQSIIDGMDWARQTVKHSKFGEVTGTAGVFPYHASDHKKIAARMKAFNKSLLREFARDDGTNMAHIVLHFSDVAPSRRKR